MTKKLKFTKSKIFIKSLLFSGSLLAIGAIPIVVTSCSESPTTDEDDNEKDQSQDENGDNSGSGGTADDNSGGASGGGSDDDLQQDEPEETHDNKDKLVINNSESSYTEIQTTDEEGSNKISMTFIGKYDFSSIDDAKQKVSSSWGTDASYELSNKSDMESFFDITSFVSYDTSATSNKAGKELDSSDINFDVPYGDIWDKQFTVSNVGSIILILTIDSTGTVEDGNADTSYSYTFTIVSQSYYDNYYDI